MGSAAKLLEKRSGRFTKPLKLARPIRVMIVDDSLTVRSVLSRMIDGEADLQVVSKSGSAELALQDLKRIPADVVLLDLEMPGMGGLAALPKILAAHEGIQALVVSSLTQAGAEHTLQALSMGAADTMPKPRAGEFDAHYCAALFEKIRALGAGAAGEINRLATRIPPAQKTLVRGRNPQVIAIGASTGGIHAMCTMLRNIAPQITLPILVTQHLPSSFMSVFAKQLEIASGRPAKVAENGMALTAGHIFIAPGNGHLSVYKSGDKLVAKITHETVRSGCTPSVDPMLRSLSVATEGNAIAIVLSGMGRDGSESAQQFCDNGGTILVQDQASCAVWGMPGSIAEKGLAAAIAAPEELGKKLTGFMGSAAWK